MMNPDESIVKAENVKKLISSFDYGCQGNADSPTASRTSNDDMDTADQNYSHHKHDLPLYSLMCQISDVRDLAKQEEHNCVLLKLSKLQDDLDKLNGVSTALDDIVRNLKCLVDSTEMLVHIMKHPKRDDALSLPHQQHEALVNIIKNCKMIIERAHWKSTEERSHWSDILLVMGKMVNTFRNIAEIVDSRLQEHQILQNDVGELLEHLSKLNFN